MRMGESAKVREEARKWMSVIGSDKDMLEVAGRACEAEGDRNGALGFYRAALARDPENLEVAGRIERLQAQP